MTLNFISEYVENKFKENILELNYKNNMLRNIFYFGNNKQTNLVLFERILMKKFPIKSIMYVKIKKLDSIFQKLNFRLFNL